MPTRGFLSMTSSVIRRDVTCTEPDAAKRRRDTTPQPGARRTAAGVWAQRDGVAIRAARDGQAVVRFIAICDAQRMRERVPSPHGRCGWRIDRKNERREERRGATAAATPLRRYRRRRMRVRKRRCGAERNDGTGWCRSTGEAGEDYASRNCRRKRERRCANFAHRLDPTSPEGHGLSRLHSTGLLKVLNT